MNERTKGEEKLYAIVRIVDELALEELKMARDVYGLLLKSNVQEEEAREYLNESWSEIAKRRTMYLSHPNITEEAFLSFIRDKYSLIMTRELSSLSEDMMSPTPSTVPFSYRN